MSSINACHEVFFVTVVPSDFASDDWRLQKLRVLALVFRDQWEYVLPPCGIAKFKKFSYR
jgi:hypothetical protein